MRKVIKNTTTTKNGCVKKGTITLIPNFPVQIEEKDIISGNLAYKYRKMDAAYFGLPIEKGDIFVQILVSSEDCNDWSSHMKLGDYKYFPSRINYKVLRSLKDGDELELTGSEGTTYVLKVEGTIFSSGYQPFQKLLFNLMSHVDKYV